MRRALVLGGGGVVGVAWETGLVAGLAEGGIDLRDADLVIGTSAGSLVGTRLAAGHDLARLPNDARGGEPVDVPFAEQGPDLPRLTQIFRIWSQARRADESFCAEIGRLAVSARTVDETAFIAATGGGVGVDDWPDKELRVTAVDVASGAFEVHSRTSGAPLAAALASSCSVPGLFPPVTIGRRRFMDGGVRSGTSADVALDAEPDVALVIAPICTATASFGPLAERALADETAQLRAAGTRVCTVLPDERDVEAFGTNLMDATRAAKAGEVGRVRGLELAHGEAAIWLG